MRSKLIDRITVSFYEETLNDQILQKILNRSAHPKFRGQKLKEIGLEYFRMQFPDLVKTVEAELCGNKIDEKPVEKSKNKKSSIGMMESW